MHRMSEWKIRSTVYLRKGKSDVAAMAWRINNDINMCGEGGFPVGNMSGMIHQ